MRKIYLLFLLVPVFSFGQKKEGQKYVDSLLLELPKMKQDTSKVNVLNEIMLFYGGSKPSSGIVYGQKALSLAKKIKWQEGIAITSNYLGRVYFQKLDYKKSLFHYNQALKTAKTKSIVCQVYANMGLMYIHQSDYTKALNYSNLSLKLAEEINDKSSLSIAYCNIGGVYHNLNKFDKAISFLKKAINIDPTQNLTNLSHVEFELAQCYAAIGKYKEAEMYYAGCVEKSQKTGSKLNEAIFLGEAVYFFYQTKQYDKALKYDNMLMILRNKMSDSSKSFCKSMSGNIYLAKAKIETNALLKKQYVDKSIVEFNESVKVSKNLNDQKLILEYYNLLSQAQKLQGNYKAAIESHELYTIYKDSVYNEDNKETIKNLEDKREIELRDKQLKINKLDIEAQEKQKWFYILGIGFLTILGGLLFYQSRNRQKTNQKLQVLNTELDQANKTKTRFFSILNHDLRSPVANLIHFLHLQQDSPELLDEETKNRMQTKTITGAENLLSSMEDILLWSKGQMENFKPQPKSVGVNQLFEDTKKVFSGYLKIKFEYQNPDNLEIFTDENYLKTIIRNLTSNAINILAEFVTSSPSTSLKRGSVEKQIIWKAWQENGKSFLSITDNGPGGSQDKFKALYDDTEVVGIKTGLGLHLIRDLAKAINCEIEVDSKVGFGTTFVLKL
jgi:signal transduction histidine kinase/Tfp pilus assembly protein PilF